MEMDTAENNTSQNAGQTDTKTSEETGSITKNTSVFETSQPLDPIILPGEMADKTMEDTSPAKVEINHNPEEISNNPGAIFQSWERNPGLQEKTGRLQEKTGRLQEKTGKLQEETGRLQENTGKPQENTRKLQEETGELQEEPGKHLEEPGKPQEEPGKLQEKTGKPQEETRLNEKVEISAENGQLKPKRKSDEWKNKLNSSSVSSAAKAAEEVKKEFRFLLKNEVSGDPGIRLCSTDEVIALNKDVKFIFKDENTIKNYLILGSPGRNYSKRQRLQIKNTTEGLEIYQRLVNQFLQISKRDYFLIFLSVQSQLRFRRNEINNPCRFVNILLFTLTNEKFTYNDIKVNLGIPRGSLAPMIRRMKELKWIGYHNAWADRYYYLSETGRKLIREAVERKTAGEVKKVQ